jgi:hypothetical protein
MSSLKLHAWGGNFRANSVRITCDFAGVECETVLMDKKDSKSKEHL